MSDWGAHHSTAESAAAGLDMSMPGADWGNPADSIWWGPNLTVAIEAGIVAEERLDDMVTRILAAWYAVGQDTDYPDVGFDSWAAVGEAGGYAEPQTQHNAIARAVARDGIVLLKNEGGVLPLAAPASIAVIGDAAKLNPAGPNGCLEGACVNGTMAVGWGSGTNRFPYLIAPLDAIRERSLANSTTTTTIIESTTQSTTEGAKAAAEADVSIVFVVSNSGEEYMIVEGMAGDRKDLDPWHGGNELVAAVAEAAAGKPVIVVVYSVGPIIMESILSHENVVSVVWAGLGGQEQGNALADILYGDTNPNGKLPYTIAKAFEDYGSALSGPDIDDNFDEGLYVDYRHFDKAGIEPRYEFGFGLCMSSHTY